MPRILLHCPDITLKGKNQGDFQNALSRNIKHRLRGGGYNWNVGASRGRVCINIADKATAADISCVVRMSQEIAGVNSLAVTSWLRRDEILKENDELNWKVIGEGMTHLARRYYTENASFAIRVNRADKRLPTTSHEMGRRLGDIIREQTDWNRVNLKQPDQIFYIDAYPDGLYLYGEKLKGIGGLPVGTGGRVLSLLSGGIDSPVAAFLMTKRGCNVDLFHMSASHVQELELEQSVIARLARQVSRYAQNCRVYIVPYTYFDLALAGQRSGYEMVLFRRFLMRTAEIQAQRIKAQALVSGDSLGQVASQTLENLVSVSRAIDMPIFRPLIGSNKNEIITLARQIGTYEISIEPYKDCCALIAQHPSAYFV